MEAGKKWSSFSDNYKYGAFILVQSEQQFKMQYYYGIFDPVNVEGQWYGGRALQALKYICELFGNI